jgi:hypothetical protein
VRKKKTRLKADNIEKNRKYKETEKRRKHKGTEKGKNVDKLLKNL